MILSFTYASRLSKGRNGIAIVKVDDSKIKLNISLFAYSIYATGFDFLRVVTLKLIWAYFWALGFISIENLFKLELLSLVVLAGLT